MKALAKWTIITEVGVTALLIASAYLVNWLDPAQADEWCSTSGALLLLAFFVRLVAQCALGPATLLSLIYLALDWYFGWSHNDHDESTVASP